MLARAPRIDLLDETEEMELDEAEVQELAGESTLAETPVPLELQSREVMRLADDHPERPDEAMLLAVRTLEMNEIYAPGINDDDDESEGPALDEELDVRTRRGRRRHPSKM